MCVDSCGSRADRQAKASRRSAIMNPSTGTGSTTTGGVKAALPQQQTVKTETGPDYWGYLNSREFQGLAANALVSVGVGLVLGGFCAATAGIGCLLAVGAAAGYSGYLAQAVVTQHYDPREAVQATIDGAAGAGIGLALAPVLSGVKSLASSAITKVLGQTSKAATKTAGLGARAAEVHGVLDPLAQARRTTAVLGTREGVTVIGGGVRDLSPAQRALARDGDLLTRQLGAHAEVTVVNGARSAGLAPDEIVTTTNICPACQRFLEGAGARITGPRSASWQ